MITCQVELKVDFISSCNIVNVEYTPSGLVVRLLRQIDTGPSNAAVGWRMRDPGREVAYYWQRDITVTCFL